MILNFFPIFKNTDILFILLISDTCTYFYLPKFKEVSPVVGFIYDYFNSNEVFVMSHWQMRTHSAFQNVHIHKTK